MTDEQEVVDPQEDNSTPPATEQEEQPAPSEEDNADIEPDHKEERWKQQIQGSKEEALKWKSEYEALKSSMEEQKDDDISVSDQDLAAFNALAKKLGYVTKAELEKETQVKTYKQVQEESLNKFLAEHPEYGKIGDPESDKKWQKLQKELAYYNTNPSDPKQWYTILSKAHGDLNNKADIARAQGESVGMAKANLAEQAKIGSRASGEVSTPKGKQTPEQKQFASEIEEQLKQKSYYKPR